MIWNNVSMETFILNHKIEFLPDLPCAPLSVHCEAVCLSAASFSFASFQFKTELWSVSMSYDVEVRKGLGPTYKILLDAAESGKISKQQAEAFFLKLDPSGALAHKYMTKVKDSYGRHEFKEGLSLWYNEDPYIFDDPIQLNERLQEILMDKDLGNNDF